MYADSVTMSMKNAINETKRRREKQITYNKENNIVPKTIIKSVPEQVTTLDDVKLKSTHDISTDIIELEAQMKKYSDDLDFEKAIECRDRIKRLEKEIQIKNDRK
jgi:excinuclease ABC subunit B